MSRTLLHIFQTGPYRISSAGEKIDPFLKKSRFVSQISETRFPLLKGVWVLSRLKREGKRTKKEEEKTSWKTESHLFLGHRYHLFLIYPSIYLCPPVHLCALSENHQGFLIICNVGVREMWIIRQEMSWNDFENIKRVLESKRYMASCATV